MLVPAVMPDNKVFEGLLGQGVLVVLNVSQLNILGQTFRPIFCGTLSEISIGSIELNPVIIKMHNAPQFRFPTPLIFPIEHVVHIMAFDSNTRLPLV
ncbi:hypothetical protein J2T13_005080 [Paenibacillus sp. DS2015]|uniref:hypothetical protein n=1 Tax=Paenibacillus sp. DS2015 TaxID=3373917 RepID=UPI003D1CA129